MMYPFWVLLSVKCPNRSDSTMEEGLHGHEWETMSTWVSWQWHLRNTEWHLKYHKDKKAWHNHTGTPTLIQILQHLRSSNEDDPGSPCSFSSRLPVRQVCWSHPFYVELNIGSTKAIQVKTMPERKGRQKDARSQGKLSVRLFPINLISKQLN